MSKSYYRFKKPITCVRVDSEGKHDKVTVWVNHQNSGTLVVDAEQRPNILDILTDDFNPVLHCYSGGDKGPCVIKNDPDISDDEYVISEYNEVVLVKDVLFGRTLVTE